MANFDPNGPVVPNTGPSNDPMEMIERSARMRGHTVRPDIDVPYWMGTWEESKHDPKYFWELLMRPEGSGAATTNPNDPLVYKTLPQVSQTLTPELPTYGGLMPKPGFDSAPPESRIFGTVGGDGTLDPREAKRAAIVRMLGRR